MIYSLWRDIHAKALWYAITFAIDKKTTSQNLSILGLPDRVTTLRFVIPHAVCEPTFFAMLKIGLTTGKSNKKQTARVCSLVGLPDRIRTYGLKSRSLVHYPAMLPVESYRYILPHPRDFFNRKLSYFVCFFKNLFCKEYNSLKIRHLKLKATHITRLWLSHQLMKIYKSAIDTSSRLCYNITTKRRKGGK